MIFTRTQYLDYMTGRHAPRPMFVELFGLLLGLDEEWKQQGATPDELNLSAFEWDTVRRCHSGGHTNYFQDQPRQILEETAHFRLERDVLGRTLQLDKRTATIALPMNFPVRNMDDWLRLKPLFAFEPRRIDDDAVEHAKLQREQHHALIEVGIPGGFDTIRELMGEELGCLAYYDQPELVHDIIATLTDTALRTLEPISRRVTIDRLAVHEDFAGRSGPLIGPTQIDEFMGPYFRAVWDMLADRGATLFAIDSDGNINSVIDALRRAGLNELYPLEPAAGMDIVAVREHYGPDLMLRGGIDKFVVRTGSKADIRRELEYKMQPAMRNGGMAFGLDHRIPDGTPLESYRYYVDTGREILGLPPRGGDPAQRQWQRTA
jgi:hypothetical protein